MNTPTEEKLLHTIALTMTDTQGDEYMHALADAIAAGVTIDQIRDYTQHALRGGKIDPDTATQVQETLADDRDCIIPQAWADTIKAAHDTHRCLIRDTLDVTTYEDQPGHVTIYPYRTGEHVEGEQDAPTDAEIQAAARALSAFDGTDWDSLGTVGRQDYSDAARAVLVAAREQVIQAQDAEEGVDDE